ncbi:MAG: ABC transporter permease DevC [Pirellulaceae bacterium]
MPRFRRTPLAWRNLTHDYRRLVVAVGGILFAVVLMFMQVGFRRALIDSTVKVIEDLNADVLLVSKGQYAMPAQQRFPMTRLVQARKCPGVSEVSPLYIETFSAELRRRYQQDGKTWYGKGYPIRVLAFNPNDEIFNIPQVETYRDRLSKPDTALLDVKSKSKYGVVPGTPAELARQPVRLSGQPLQLVGTFSMGTDFANDGNLIMSTKNFTRYFPYRAGNDDPLSIVDFGLVQLDDNADPQVVKARLRQILPTDVAVYTKQEFIQLETSFWEQSTPIGYIFTVGTVMGFVVGVIICYQIIYSNVADYLAEFATLKAMGYSDRYFIVVVLSMSFYLSLLGFVPGWFLSWLLYQVLAEATGLLMLMSPLMVATVYGLTLLMCVVSGGLAMRKLLGADPAELF